MEEERRDGHGGGIGTSPMSPSMRSMMPPSTSSFHHHQEEDGVGVQGGVTQEEVTRCLILLETKQTTTEKRLAGLLVLLHLLKRSTKTIMNTNDDGGEGEGGARLARLAFARLNEAHAEKLGRALREAKRGEQEGAHNMGWQQLDLEISVCAALAQMSPEVARDPNFADLRKFQNPSKPSAGTGFG